jgi:16S rRNA (guanine527-N7)-methyltransferase
MDTDKHELKSASPAPAPMTLPLVRKHFPELPEATVARLERLGALVRAWNERLNLISRKDAENLEERHLLHALTMTKVLRPARHAKFADIGTGGGFPGLVLAIVYPACEFTLIDSVGKKIAAVEAMAGELGLKNVRGRPVRAETIREKFDFVTGRAVTALPVFLGWAGPLLRRGAHGAPSNGVLYFKGTLWREELAGGAVQPAAVWPLERWVPREFFQEKFLLHFPAAVVAGGA